MGIPYEQLPRHLRGDAPPPELTEDISWGDSWEASWETEAPAGAIWDMTMEGAPSLTEEQQLSYERNEYNPVNSFGYHYPELDDPLLHPYIADMKSDEQLHWKVAKLKEEIEARRIAQEAPGLQQFITDVGVSIVASPTTYAEAGLAILTRNPIIASGSLAVRGATRAAQFGGLAALGTGIDEFILHQNQDLRTKTETAAAVVGGFVLGGAFGWATGREVVRLNNDLSANTSSSPLTGPAPTTPSVQPLPGGAAARLDDISQEDYNKIMSDKDMTAPQKDLAIMMKQAENYEVVGGLAGIGRGAAKLAAIARISPEVSMAVSGSPVMRRFGAFVTNSPLSRAGQMEGEGFTNLDAVARRGSTDIEVNVPKIFNEGYAQHKKEGGGLTREQHDMEVQLAVTRGIKSDIPTAQAAAAKLNDKYLVPLGKRGVRGNFLKGKEDGTPVAPLGDQAWFLRSYSRGYALRTTPDQYADGLVEPYMVNLRKNVADETAELEAKIEKMQADTDKMRGLYDAYKESTAAIKPMSFNRFLKNEADKMRRAAPKAKELRRIEKNPERLRARFKNMHSTIRKGGDAAQNTEYSGTGVRMEADGTFKMSEGRTLDIPTEALPRDYLDPEAMMSIVNALKRMNRQLLVTEDPRFHGDPTFNYWRDLREKEHNARLAEAAGDLKKTKKLETQFKKDNALMDKTVQAYYDIKPGTAHEMTQTVFANIKAFNALTGLGTVLFSTIPELGAALSHNGVRGYVKLATSWLSDPKAMMNMTRLEKEWMDIGIQTNLGTRIAEKGEYSSGMGKASRWMHKISDMAVDKVYGLGVWTRGISAQTAAITQFKLGSIMTKKTMTKRDIADLGRLGIKKDHWDVIKTEIDNHSEKISGNSRNLHLEKWDNQAVAQDVINAINAEVDNVIIRPGVGSTPFIGRTMAGSVALQFKQFLMAATSKYLVTDIQRVAMGDWRAIERQLAFLALGYASASLKNNYLYGEDAADRWANKDFGEQMIDAISAGGGTGLGMDVVNTGIEMVNPGAGSSRFYGQRSWQSMMLGPTVSKAVEEVPTILGIAGSAMGADRTYTKSDAKTLWRNIPGNSFWPIRLGFTQTTGKGGHEMLYEVTK
jgi:hypothetical protein